MPALNRLYKDYQDRVAFYVVYIEEAHPIDAWQVDDNLEDDVLVASTRTLDERVDVAGVCMTKLGIELPAVVDGLLSEPGAAVSASDPGTGAPYEYARIDDATYEVCATFHQSATLREPRSDADFWTHGEGRQCFRREARRVQ